MDKTKILVIGGLMACITALTQILPTILSEAFVILTLFSALPIYIICRINIRIGIAACIASFILIGLFSTHEAMFFIFTNGPVGVSLGCCSHLINKKYIIPFVSSVIVCATLSILNFIVGIPVFGVPLPGMLLIQLFIIFIFALVYCFIYFYFCDFMFKKLSRFIE